MEDNKIKELKDKIEEGVSKVFQSENYRNYLKTMSNFHNYSFNNTMLIFLQRPDSTLVAGYNTWQKMKRQVNKGEKGIRILAPMKFKTTIEVDVTNDKGEKTKEPKEVEFLRFKPVSVFDVGQTKGEPLPELTKLLNDTVENYPKIISALENISPYPVEYKPIEGEAKGYCSFGEQAVVVREGMPELQTIKTLIHEVAHAKLHNPDNDENKIKGRAEKELEAESTAYVVCEHFGLDTSEYSFPYLASWSAGKELDVLAEALENIHNTATEIIKTIEAELVDLQQQQKKEVAQATAQPEVNDTLNDSTSNKLNIIGNTPYRQISNRTRRNLDSKTAEEIISKIDSAGIAFSGIMNNDGSAVISIDKNNSEAIDNIIGSITGRGKMPFSKEEVDITKQTNIVEYLASKGIQTKRVGVNEYTLPEHDSMRIRDNKFVWNSQNIGGNALNFCIEYLGMDFKAAVQDLLSFNGYDISQGISVPITPRQPITSKKEEQQETPHNPIPNELSSGSQRAFAYLTQTRGIDTDIIQKLISEGKIAQDIRGNAVFKIFDENGNLSGAELTSTNTSYRFKQLTERGGNGFTVSSDISTGKPTNIVFCESAIDTLSCYNINRNVKDCLFISMAGLKDKVVQTALERYNISPDKAFIAVDCDEAGKNFAQKMQQQGFKVFDLTGTKAYKTMQQPIKDWNDLLKALKGITPTTLDKTLSSCQQEADKYNAQQEKPDIIKSKNQNRG